MFIKYQKNIKLFTCLLLSRVLMGASAPDVWPQEVGAGARGRSLARVSS